MINGIFIYSTADTCKPQGQNSFDKAGGQKKQARLKPFPPARSCGDSPSADSGGQTFLHSEVSDAAAEFPAGKNCT